MEKLKIYMVCYKFTNGVCINDKTKIFTTKEKAKQYFDTITINRAEQRRIAWYDQNTWEKYLMGQDFMRVVKQDNFFSLEYDDGHNENKETIIIKEIEID